MCNLYSMTSNRDAIQQLAKAFNQSLGNLPPLPGIYPDYLAPIVRLNADGEREIVLARWEGYLGVEHRCLVPLNRFAEPCKLDDGSSGNAWFALNKDEPLTFFAGLWTEWKGTRRKDEGPHTHLVFAFFTTAPNDVVGAVHPKAMPVILTSGEEQAQWLTAPWSEARKLQRPLPDGELEIVHRTALRYLPGVDGIPSGDPLRLNALPPKEPSLS